MPRTTTKHALSSANRALPLTSEPASSDGVFSIAASRALRLMPRFKAELPGLVDAAVEPTLLLSSIRALIERNRPLRDDPDALLAAARHELAKLKYVGDPESTDADHARLLASSEWDHSIAIRSEIRARLPPRLLASVSGRTGDKAINRSFRRAVRAMKQQRRTATEVIEDEHEAEQDDDENVDRQLLQQIDVSKGCIHATVLMLTEALPHG